MSNNDSQSHGQGDSYFEGHQTGFEEQVMQIKIEEEKAQLELERLCYEVFMATNDGTKLWEIFTEKFLLPALCAPNSPNFRQECIYFDGFKQAFRSIMGMARNHQRRILSAHAQGVA